MRRNSERNIKVPLKLIEFKVEMKVPHSVEYQKMIKSERMIKLINSIREIGMVNPLVIIPSLVYTGKYEAAVGNERLYAVKQLGWDEVECVIVNSLKEGNDYERDYFKRVEGFWP